jgi:mannosyltransferase
MNYNKFNKNINKIDTFFKENILLFILLIIGFILRIINLNKNSYWVDESISINQVMNSFFKNISLVANDVHPPLYNIILWVWTRIFGFSEFSTRFLSVIFSVLSILILYLIVKKLFSKDIAIYSTIILVFSKVHIYYAQETRMYSLLIFLSLLSMYYFILFFLNNISKENNKNKKSLIYNNYSLSYILSSVLLIYTHIFSFFILFIQGLIILLYKRNKLIIFLKNNIILFILYLPWIPVIISQFIKVNKSFWILKPNILSLYNTILEFSGGKILFYIFMTIIFISFILIIFKKKINYRLIFIICWFIIPIIILFIISVTFKPVYLTRYTLYCSLPYFILIGYSINNISKSKIIKWGIISIIIFLSLINIFAQYKENPKEDWENVVYLIKEKYNNEQIIIQPNYEIYPFLYYFDKECFKDGIKYNIKEELTFSNCNPNIYGVNQIYNYTLLSNETFWLVKYYHEYYKTNESYYILKDLNQSNSIYLYEKIKNIGIYIIEPNNYN